MDNNEKALCSLAKVCEMLSSDFDNERAIAATKATRILKSLEMSWTDLVTGYQQTIAEYTPHEQRREPEGVREHVGQVKEILEDHEHYETLSDWEYSFCQSILERFLNRPVSKKQQEIIDRLYEQL